MNSADQECLKMSKHHRASERSPTILYLFNSSNSQFLSQVTKARENTWLLKVSKFQFICLIHTAYKEACV